MLTIIQRFERSLAYLERRAGSATAATGYLHHLHCHLRGEAPSKSRELTWARALERIRNGETHAVFNLDGVSNIYVQYDEDTDSWTAGLLADSSDRAKALWSVLSTIP